MRRITLHIAVVVAFALAMSAQQSGSKQDQSKSSSPAAAHSSEKHSAKTHTLTGCLSGPNSEGAYELTTGGQKIEVGGNDELKNHVGHEVTLTGNWASSAELGEKEAAEKSEKGEKGEKGEKAERHLKVSTIKMVAEKCSSPSASHSHKAKKSKAETPTT